RTASLHPWRNVVTRALSGTDDVLVDVFEVPVETGDRLLLCSDGLSSVVTEERIGEVLAGEGRLDATCSRLVDLANIAGGPDNITVIVLEIDVA
ncbi:MAG: serine/threonine protein phosphatase, partial [Acidobacteria bacterium]|nr:serine/threonine protein phosphatase [Acidobacteriota bacterium]